MKEYSYLALAYRQSLDREASYLLSFVAPVDELAEWAGVPRRDRSDGFQRLDDPKRVRTIEGFFRLSENQSPTSIVVGVPQSAAESGAVSVDPLFVLQDYGASGLLAGPRADDALSAESPPSAGGVEIDLDSALQSLIRSMPPVLCRVTFRIDPEQSIEEIAGEYRAVIQARIAGDPEEDALTEDAVDTSADGSADALPEGETASLDDVDTATGGVEGIDEGEEADGAPEDGSLDIRDSSLRVLARRLSHPTWVRQRERDIRDLAKPATIIDGQHRVLGASSLGSGIPFSVVALMSASWAEEVFQFTILNYTAKPLPSQFIAGNAAITLTRGEMAGLRERLKVAGIKIKDVDIFAAIGADSRSPFYDLISVQEKNTQNKLGYGTMMSVGSAWMDANPQFLQDLLLHLYPAENKRIRLETWRAGVWQTFFWAFWEEVRNHFESDDPDLWRPGSDYRLMITAVLKIIQEEIFRFFDGQLSFWGGTPASVDATGTRLREHTRTVLAWLPPDLFKAAWTVSGIQGSSTDREKVRQVIANLLSTRGGFRWRNSGLVRPR